MTTINNQSEDLPKIGTNDADDQIEADGSDTAAHNRSSDGGSSDSPRADDRSGSASDGQKYRKRRRLKGGDHHRRWNKLGTGDKPQAEEKKTLPQQKDAANSKARFVRGKPMAPFNSNRYLMDQHEPSEVAQHLDSAAEGAPAFSEDGAAAAAKRGGERWGSWDSDDDYHYENAVDEEAEENFLAKEFAETYQTYRAERLQAMSKEDLIREFIAMETKVEQLETMLAAKRAAPSSSSSSAVKKSRSERKLEAEVARLSKENVKLTAEFEDYRQLHS